MIVLNEIFYIEVFLYYTQYLVINTQEAVALIFLDYNVLYDVSKSNKDNRQDGN